MTAWVRELHIAPFQVVDNISYFIQEVVGNHGNTVWVTIATLVSVTTWFGGIFCFGGLMDCHG